MKRAILRYASVAALAAAFALPACDDSSDATTGPTGRTPTRDASTPTPGTQDAGRDGDIALDGAVALTDADIAAIAAAINRGEIEQGNVARTKAVNADVRAFAAQMVTEHTATLSRQTALFQRLGIEPRENEVSRMLTKKAQDDLASLQARVGADFDLGYMDVQVVMHTAALAMLDTQLIPNAKNGEVRADLTTTRASVRMHLDHATQIRSALGATDGGVTDGGATDGGATDGGVADGGADGGPI